ncbi:uricase-2 isozyme 1-like isoform X1 [Nicotiana tabacum]|uniref:Uricase-2 isozyme 1-like isoform X1 n=1 Tax=Nicotiana tabacum TaxID=4097 RepID=A0AC58SFH4_TOBAC
MAEVNGLKLEQRHGKSRVRVARVWKSHDGKYHFAEWSVNISLLSDCLPAYVAGDNSDIVATDTMKNTVYAKAKECSEQLSAEDFAIILAKHFTSFYQQVTAAIVDIVEKPWERISIKGQHHEHGFKLGSEKHTTEVMVDKSGTLRMTSGIEGLSVLKTTKSGFEGFIRDKYTMLPETRERMMATEVTASWRFPDISFIQLKMPNLHFLPVNLSSKDNPVIVKFDNDVYLPTDEPHGTIQATLNRIRSKM